MGLLVRNGLKILCCATVLLITGCSGIRGHGESAAINYPNICVESNLKVTVPSFESDLVYQLENRDLRVEVVTDKSDCEFPMALTYTAFRRLGVVTKIKLSLYKNNLRVANIDWDAGRSPMPSEISNTLEKVEFWQTGEALAGLFGEIDIN